MGTELSTVQGRKDFISQLGEAFGDAIPAKLGLTRERFAKTAIMVLNENEKLRTCTPNSIAKCLVTSAGLGLEPNTPQGLAYLIPYGKECTFIISYKGLIELARRSGQIADIYAEVVREGEDFTETSGLNRNLFHVPDRNSTAPIILSYAVAKFKDGTDTYAVISKNDIEQIKQKVKRGKMGNIWADWEGEMWKKTAIRRLSKTLPASVLDNRVHVALGDEQSENIPQTQPKLLTTGSHDYGTTAEIPQTATETEPEAPVNYPEPPSFTDSK